MGMRAGMEASFTKMAEKVDERFCSVEQAVQQLVETSQQKRQLEEVDEQVAPLVAARAEEWWRDKNQQIEKKVVDKCQQALRAGMEKMAEKVDERFCSVEQAVQQLVATSKQKRRG